MIENCMLKLQQTGSRNFHMSKHNLTYNMCNTWCVSPPPKKKKSTYQILFRTNEYNHKEMFVKLLKRHYKKMCGPKYEERQV